MFCLLKECAETGKNYTYQELGDKTWKLSKSLRKILNLDKGDKVAIFSKNCPDYLVAAIGIIRGGMVITTLNPMYTPGKKSPRVSNANLQFLLTFQHIIIKLLF